MIRRTFKLIYAILLWGGMHTQGWAQTTNMPQLPRNAPMLHGAHAHGDHQPAAVAFIPNAGQWDAPILHRADIRNGRVWLTPDGLTALYYEPEGMQRIHDLGRAHDTLVTIGAHALKLTWQGGNPTPAVQATGTALPTAYNFFLGNDPTKWASNLQAHDAVTYRDIYPGVDMEVTTGESGTLKYNLVLQPGARLQDVRLQYLGADEVELHDNHLHLHTSMGTFEEHAPETYLLTEKGTRQQLQLQYRLHADGTIGFEVPEWQGQHTLYIDPELVFSTYTGSFSDNWGMTATFDEDGALYSGGVVAGPNFPATPGAVQLTYGGGQGSPIPGLDLDCDMAILKFNPTGTQILWATFLGGSHNEYPASMICNEQNELFVMGASLSTNFPVLASAYDNSHNGGADIVISRISANGNVLLGSTYLGGSNHDGQNLGYYGPSFSRRPNYLWYFFADETRGEIILDNNGDVLLASVTASTNFPVTSSYGGTFGGGDQDGVVTKLDPGLTTLLASTYIPGNRNDGAYSVKVNSRNEPLVAGGTLSTTGLQIPADAWQPNFHGNLTSIVPDGFVLHFDPDLDTLLAGSYVGTNAYDQAYFVDLDSVDAVYLYGLSEGPWPVQAEAGESGIYQVANGRQYVMRLDTNLQNLEFSTRWGSGVRPRADITPTAFLVDICGNIYMSGWGGIESWNRERTGVPTVHGNTNGLPTSADAWQSTTDGRDFYIMVLDPNARGLQYATYFGENTTGLPGNRADHVDGGTCRFDKQGRIYHAVCASCGGTNNFPTTPGAVSSNNNSLNCNNAAFKFNFDLISFVQPQFEPLLQVTGCAPYPFQFQNTTTTSQPLTTGTLVYEWTFGDTTSGVVNASSDFEPIHEYANAGIYTARLRARVVGEACTLEDSIIQEIVVYESNDPAMDITPTQCTASASIANLSDRGTTFRWHFSDDPADTLFTTDTTTFVHDFPNPGLYDVKLVVNPNSLCTDSVETQVLIGALPAASFTAAPSPCVPEVQLSPQNSTATVYRWRFSDDENDTLRTTQDTPFVHTYPEPGEYRVTLVVDPDSPCPDSLSQEVVVGLLPPAFSVQNDSCSLALTLQQQATMGQVLRWEFGPNLEDTIRQLVTDSDPVTWTFPQRGTYDIRLVVNPDGPCPLDSVLTLTVNNPPQTDFEVISDPCTPDARFVNTTLEGEQFRWHFSDDPADTLLTTSLAPIDHVYTEAGLYEVKLVANPHSACRDSTIQTVRAGIQAPAFELDIDTCLLTVTCQNTSLLGSSFRWQFSDDPADTLFTTSIEPFVHSFPAGGSYTVKLIVNPYDICADSLEQQIDLFLPPEGALQWAREGCSRTWVAASTMTGADFYQWELDGEMLAEPSDTLRLNLAEGGEYLLTLRASSLPDQCVREHTEVLSIPQPISIAFATEVPDCDDLYHLRNSSTGDAVQWQWTINGQPFEGANMDYLLTEGDSMRVRLEATDADGCIFALDSAWVHDLGRLRRLRVPNVFTPNNDGINDRWIPETNNPDCLEHLLIFNRWGVPVYDTPNPSAGWDGLYNGTAVPAGVYMFLLRLRDGAVRSGSVTILR